MSEQNPYHDEILKGFKSLKVVVENCEDEYKHKGDCKFNDVEETRRLLSENITNEIIWKLGQEKTNGYWYCKCGELNESSDIACRNCLVHRAR